MRIALALLLLAAAVYLVVRGVQRRLDGAASDIPSPRNRDAAAEETYRQAVRERAERQRRGIPEPEAAPRPSLVELDEDVFECNDSMQSMAEYFVVGSPAPARAVAAAVDRASERFMLVDELGREHADHNAMREAFRAHTEWDLYTPNYTA